MKRIEPSEKHTKTYASEKRLEKALTSLGLADQAHMIHTFNSGRKTAVFTNIINNYEAPAVVAVASAGFMVIG